MRLGLTVCVFALAVCCGAATTHKTRLVALAPTVGPDRKLEWLKVQYEANKGTDSVGIEHYLGEEATDRLGGFADVSFAYGTPQQSCRLDGTGDRLFCLGRTNASTVDIGECCGDSLVVYFRDGRDRQVVNLVSSMRSALLSAGDVSITEEPTVWPSFYFWPYSPGGGVQRIIIAFSFESDALDLGEGGVINGFGGIHADYGFMVFELVETVRDDVTGVIPIPTQGGSMAVIGFRDLGTVSSDVSDHIWRIQYDTLSRQPSVNRLFVSGLTSFTEEATGIVYIVYSNRYQSEVVVITDPWAHPVTVEIVQRFGTPPILNLDSGDAVGYNYFGLSEDESRDWTPGSGMSNPYHTFYPVVGMHSITVVANTAGNQGQAKVYEFVFQPRTQSRLNGMKGPSVFKVPYIRTNVGISIPTMGGAKPVGEKLYFVATGTSKDFVGLMVIDKEGGVVQRCLSPDAAQSATGISDPFIFTYVYDDNLFTVENGSKFDRKMLVHK